MNDPWYLSCKCWHSNLYTCMHYTWPTISSILTLNRPHNVYLVRVDDSPEEGLAGVAAHPPVVKVRDRGVAAHRTGDSRFAWITETIRQTRRTVNELQKRDNNHFVHLLGTGLGINLHAKLQSLTRLWTINGILTVIMIFCSPAASSGAVCLHFSFVFLQLPEFFTEDFRLFVSTSANSSLVLIWVSGLAGAGNVLTRLKAENLGGWKAEWMEGVNSCWLCRENLSIISGPLISDNDRLRSVSAESRTRLTSSSMYSLFMLSSWLFRSISLPLPSLRYPGRALDSCFLLGVWAGTSSRNMRKCQYGDGLWWSI